jgi:hypothetical protein
MTERKLIFRSCGVINDEGKYKNKPLPIVTFSSTNLTCITLEWNSGRPRQEAILTAGIVEISGKCIECKFGL